MWHNVQNFTDITYHKSEDGIAKITINRPEVRNAFRPLTVQELLAAFDLAHEDPAVGVIILTKTTLLHLPDLKISCPFIVCVVAFSLY